VILDNFYFIEEQVKEIQRNLSIKNYSKLQNLKRRDFKSYPRVLALIIEHVSHTTAK
jgi:cyclic beta-1,2-glucan synthetase